MTSSSIYVLFSILYIITLTANVQGAAAYEEVAEVQAVDSSDSSNILIIDEDGTTCDETTQYCGIKFNLDYLKKLNDVARKRPLPKDKKIAVGFNANVDMIVNGLGIVKALKPKPRDVKIISTLTDFVDSFAYWFQKGAAAERFVDSPDLFKDIVSSADTADGKVLYRTGGNAALMATNLASLSCKCDVLLGGIVGKQLDVLLQSNIKTVGKRGFEEDPIHLILEYPKGATWNGMVAPRANRFIVVSDEYNANLKAFEPMMKYIFKEQKENRYYDALIASGLNQLEGLKKENRMARVLEIKETLKMLHPRTPIHLELASMADRKFLKQMAEELLSISDSFGLNEEELAMLYEVLGGKYATILDGKIISKNPLKVFTRDQLTGKIPEPRAVALALAYIMDYIDFLPSSNFGNRRVTRGHFHSLGYHLIVSRLNSNKQSWTPLLDSAVAQGSITATLKACDFPNDGIYNNRVKQNDIEMISPLSFTTSDGSNMELSLDNPVAIWAEGQYRFFYAPVLICHIPKVTVGLGDSISSNGLAYSLKI
eukprot:g5980.t1